MNTKNIPISRIAEEKLVIAAKTSRLPFIPPGAKSERLIAPLMRQRGGQKDSGEFSFALLKPDGGIFDRLGKGRLKFSEEPCVMTRDDVALVMYSGEGLAVKDLKRPLPFIENGECVVAPKPEMKYSVILVSQKLNMPILEKSFFGLGKWAVTPEMRKLLSSFDGLDGAQIDGGVSTTLIKTGNGHFVLSICNLYDKRRVEHSPDINRADYPTKMVRGVLYGDLILSVSGKPLEYNLTFGDCKEAVEAIKAKHELFLPTKLAEKWLASADSKAKELLAASKAVLQYADRLVVVAQEKKA